MPPNVRYLMDMYSEVLLANSIHQLNRGGYTLRHAVLVYGNGLLSSIFYTLISNESRIMYLRAISAIKYMLSLTENVKMIVMDRNLVQLNSFEAAYSEARVCFSRFYVLTDIRCRYAIFPIVIEVTTSAPINGYAT